MLQKRPWRVMYSTYAHFTIIIFQYMFLEAIMEPSLTGKIVKATSVHRSIVQILKIDVTVVDFPSFLLHFIKISKCKKYDKCVAPSYK